MKIWTGLLALLLAGCGSVDQIEKMTLLYTAPLDESMLLHPDWAEPSEPAESYRISGPRGQQYAQHVGSLEHFLAQQGIDYEVVAGGHIMIKLKQQVNFKTGSSYVSKQSREWLDQLGVYLANRQDLDIVIDGHTDSTGGITVNDKLSRKRAEQVKAQLKKNRVSDNHIFTRGYGEYMPACSNETSSGRACNRRVEITFILANN